MEVVLLGHDGHNLGDGLALSKVELGEEGLAFVPLSLIRSLEVLGIPWVGRTSDMVTN